MNSTADFKNGLNIMVDGEPYTIVWFQHHKPGKGGAVMRTKMKHLRTGSIIERSFKSGERFGDVSLEKHKKQFLYHDGDNYHFMDTENFEQIHFPKEKLGKSADFLTENLEVDAIYLEGEFIAIELPIIVELKVAQTVPGIKGDSVSNMVKPATLENGIEIQVPLFIKEGDKIRVDTRTGEYIERA
ncbi:MAG: elongation factor P [Elusimicrobia bacterium RIFOXYB2_FULL_50_12]|nr:MAG: elongation factor P [Elusimicrobia bacterium RIFOXYB2_FULL_50_12]